MTTAASSSNISGTTGYRPGAVRNRILWTLQIVLGLFFIIASGGPKLVIPRTLMENGAANVTLPLGLIIFIGLAEVSGGIGLMVPRLSGLAAAGLSVLTLLAAVTQAFIADLPSMAIFPLVLSAIFAWIAYERRGTITALVR